ncbi:MAG: hypothetical protein GF418_14060 [Chitinivibrionales bacterium]|nr:hypothetical protein [Chitinivibrionales bacterium]MBD3396743.1 hypothetical protein [Chitinivibrionales bacterium]
MRPKPSFGFPVSLVLSVVLAAAGASAQQSAQEERVRIMSVVGKAEVKSAKSPNWRPARVNMPVKMGWDVRTYVESSIELRYESGTVIKLGENSVVTLSKAYKETKDAGGDVKMKIATGEVWGNVKKLVNKKSNFSFETPTAVASIRGTIPHFVSQPRRDLIECFDGAMDVTNKASGKTVRLEDKQAAVLVPGENDISVSTVEAESTPWSETTEGDADMSLSIGSPASGEILEESPVTVKGTTEPGAKVTCGEQSATAGNDGAFSLSVDLTVGTNEVTVKAESEDLSKSTTLILEYKPQLTLSVKNITDNMEVMAPELSVEVEVSDGAEFSIMVNKEASASPVKLEPGKNTITVTASDQWDNQLTQEFTVRYKESGQLTLSVTSPAEGQKIDTTLIKLQGTTARGASVTVDGTPVTVVNGTFSDQIHIPDEPGEFTLEIRAELGGQETVVERTVSYEPVREELTLTVSSPRDGEVMEQSPIRVAGTTTPSAKVTVNGRTATVFSDGRFTADLMVTEREAGDLQIEVVAANEQEDMTASINVQVGIKSPSINTSMPQVIVVGQNQRASKNDELTIQVLDRTPNDEITLSVELNGGSEDEYAMEPNSYERVKLEEGKNTYLVKARDLAGNVSGVVRGERYYLPGPLDIEVNTPDENPYIIDDLPPMPRDVGGIETDIEVEIEDQIGEVPETILYVRVQGSGQNVQLNKEPNYVYTGRLRLNRGTNQFVIEVEDIAGNKQQEILRIIIED